MCVCACECDSALVGRLFPLLLLLLFILFLFFLFLFILLLFILLLSILFLVPRPSYCSCFSVLLLLLFLDFASPFLSSSPSPSFPPRPPLFLPDLFSFPVLPSFPLSVVVFLRPSSRVSV